MESPFHTEDFGTSFSRVDSSIREFKHVYSNVFIRNVHLFMHELRLQIFGILRKEYNFILHYAAMFDKGI